LVKKKSASQELEKESKSNLERCFSGWIVNELKDEDFGLDFKIRFTSRPSGVGNKSRDVMPVHFFAQLKATSGTFQGEDNIKYQLETDLIETFWKSESPIVILLYESETGTFYWRILQDYFHNDLEDKHEDWHNQETVKLAIDKNNSFQKSDKENDGSEDILKFAENIFQTRMEIIRRFHRRMSYKDGLDDLSDSEVREIRQDNFIKAISSLIGRAEQFLEKEDLEYVENELNKATHMMNNTIFYPTEEVAEKARFDALGVVCRAISICKRADCQNALSEFKEIENNLIWQIRMFEGAVYRNKELGENFEILRVDRIPGSNYWIALQQYEDGVFWDENLSAIIRMEKYQYVGLKEERSYERMCEEHSFDDNDICEECGLSVVSIGELGGDLSPKCQSCGKRGEKTDWDKWENSGNIICPECRSD
jgi:hypothetical protein